MPRGFHKHKLLLDENMRPRTRFPRLNSRFDVKHIQEDFKRGGLSDGEVYRLAVKQQRILVTTNSKDFRHLAGTMPDAGIIGVSANLSANQIDLKLTALLMKATHKSLQEKFTSLTGETDAA